MKSPHLPRHTIILILFLLGITFLVGNVLIFTPALAAKTELQLSSFTGTLQPTLTDTLTLTPTEPPYPPSADTTGILLLGILLVAIILIGLLWGNRLAHRRG